MANSFSSLSGNVECLPVVVGFIVVTDACLHDLSDMCSII